MSGHSKWSQIRHKKSLVDQKRGKIFSKLSRAITLAARIETDPDTNPSLAQAIDKARSFNMPKENIERAINKNSDKSSSQLEELTIEAIGPVNIAVRIKVITDSRNRSISEIRKVISGNNFKMVAPNSISWMFQQPPIKIMDDKLDGQITKFFEELDENDDVEEVLSNLE
jgi:YebC/PmpR family DNA-binding regulatory protein